MPAFAKKMVKDVRDNTWLFGEIRSCDNGEESMFSFDKTDMVQVGLGTMEQTMPVSGIRIYSNITTLEDAIAFDVLMGISFYDCDNDAILP